MQGLINEQLQIQFNVANGIRVGLIELGSTTAMTFAVLSPILLQAQIQIAGSDNMPDLSGDLRTRALNGLLAFGFSDGLTLQLQDQIAGPMILFEKQVTRVLISQDINDLVPCVFEADGTIQTAVAFSAIVPPAV